MKVTYHHTFATGITATAVLSDEPVQFLVRWSSKPTGDMLPEYRRWRNGCFEDFERRTGRRVLVLDPELLRAKR